jgi:putative ABC transport system permease protein
MGHLRASGRHAGSVARHRVVALLEVAVRDLSLAFRTLRKNPGVAAIVVVTLGLGLGLTTTMFSIIDGILLKGLPFPDPHRLYAIERLGPGGDDARTSLRDYADLRERQHAFDDIAAYARSAVALAGTPAGADLVNGTFVTANLFRLLGQQAALGRTFRDADGAPDSPPVVILSDGVWRRDFGADPNVLDAVVHVDGMEMRVVGVMPSGFGFPDRQETWQPMRLDPLQVARSDPTSGLSVIGRLRHDMTASAARLEYDAIAHRLADEYPTTNRNIGVHVEPLIDAFVGREPKAMLLTMFGAVLGVLLVACATVANLLLARTMVRAREVSIRMALGGPRWRVVSQLMTETLVLAALGGVLGLGIAQLGVTAFNRSLAIGPAPTWVHIGVNMTLVAFVGATAVLSALAAGLVPALQASGTNVSEGLKDEARGFSSFRMGKLSRALVVAEVAVSCGLLVGAGLMAKSVIGLATVDYGFATDDVITVRVLLTWFNRSTGRLDTNYPDNSPRRQQFWAEVLRRVRAEPGVAGASLTSELPGRAALTNDVTIEGRTYADERDATIARRAVIATRYFDTFGVRVEGREFLDSDGEGSLPVAIVNRSFAKRFGAAGGSAMGMRFREGIAGSKEPWRTVVGVVPDMYMAGNDSTTLEGYYTPLAQANRRVMNVVARARGDPLALANAIQRDVAAIDPDVPAYAPRTQRRVIDESIWRFEVFGALFIVFGVVALVLATVGLYGVMAFAVSRRTRDIGVRMALGATGTDVLRLFLREGLVQLGVGVSIGMLLAYNLATALSFVLLRVSPRDPVVFAAIAALLVVVGLMACFIPARRASRVDPLVALRSE